VSAPFRESQTDGHPEVECRFLVQPDLPGEIVNKLFD
jgi:hypothetical protein